MAENTSTRHDEGEKNEEIDSTCGIGQCRPRGIQCFRNVLSFALFYGMASLVTNSLTAYIVSQVTAVEKQFNLNSASMGLILGCNDIGFLCAVLFFSHFGRGGHIPRILSSSVFVFGASGIMSGLCYFLSPVYLPKLSADTMVNSSDKNIFTAPLCSLDKPTDSCEGGVEQETGNGPTWPIWVLGASMALQGMGKSPRTSLSATYIDNNNPEKTKTAFYLGISSTLTILGNAIAVAVGGLFRRIPIDLQETILTPNHPKWIGAWWLGFFMFGSLAILLSIPLMLFPKSIISRQKKVENKEPFLEDVKELPRSVIRVFKQPIYTLTLAALLCMVFTISGSNSFAPKYVENQFMIPAYQANILLGVQKLASIAFGTFLGGFLTSRLKLTRYGCLKMVLICLTVAMCCGITEFFLGCDTPVIHGFHRQPGGISDDSLAACNCDTTDYFPVCGEGDTYFSPCFAGCKNQSESLYGGCSQISTGQTLAGMCPTDCPYLYYYIGENLVSNAITTMFVIPTYITLIRSVNGMDKTMAIGIMSFLNSLLGFLPSPILYGFLVDTTCLIWEMSCGTRGACAQYDLSNLRYRMKLAELGGFMAGCFFVILALVVLRRKGEIKVTEMEIGLSVTPAKKSENTRL